MKRIKANIWRVNPEMNIVIVEIVNGLLVTETRHALRGSKKQIWKEVKP